MRRQYHSRLIHGHRHIWDVHRLIALSRELPVIDVPLDQIRELDEPFWFDTSHDDATCRQVVLHATLMDEASLEYPIILSQDGRVMDGMHRVCKALKLGAATVSAVRFVRDPEPDHVDANVDDLPYDDPL